VFGWVGGSGVEVEEVCAVCGGGGGGSGGRGGGCGLCNFEATSDADLRVWVEKRGGGRRRRRQWGTDQHMRVAGNILRNYLGLGFRVWGLGFRV